jgi:VWFA-related protein
MRKTYILLLILIGIASISYAAIQFRAADSDIILAPGASRSLVLIDARVTDENGNFVQGLQAEDFEIYQDGRPQEIAKFYVIDRKSSEADPRTVIFAVDDIGLSKTKFNQVRTALRYFADKVMSSSDVVAIVQTSGPGFVLQPLTSDAAKMRGVVDRWQWCLETARPFGGLAARWTSSSEFVSSCSGST